VRAAQKLISKVALIYSYREQTKNLTASGKIFHWIGNLFYWCAKICDGLLRTEILDKKFLCRLPRSPF
jgi:hypothetical protein